jgi:hypothetical protein
MVLAWSTGAMAGSMAESLREVRLMCDVAQVRAAVARSKQRGRIAIVIADNLKTHTAAGSMLVRTMLDSTARASASSVYASL